uniref:Secreted protein n=1 Tax=Acrobeloides nanus TaxID=290746 RepID=A0A914DPT7_9BILA
MKGLFAFGLCFLALIKPIQSNNCTGCQEYQCWEQEAQCGPNGYFLEYGLKYCNRSSDPDVVRTFPLLYATGTNPASESRVDR